MQIGPQANFWTLNLSWDPWVNHCIKPEDIKLSKMCHCRVRQSGGTGQSSWYCKHYSWGGYLRKKIPQALGFLEISRQRGEQTDVLQLCQMGTLQALNSEKSYWFGFFFFFSPGKPTDNSHCRASWFLLAHCSTLMVDFTRALAVETPSPRWRPKSPLAVHLICSHSP